MTGDLSIQNNNTVYPSPIYFIRRLFVRNEQ